MVTRRAQLANLTGNRVSPSTITRLLKAAGDVWKRIKNTMTDRRPEEEFEATPVEIQELKPPPQVGDLELWFFDESGFEGPPSVPYAWQHGSEWNLIEILWRFLKYSWLPFAADLSFDHLVKELEKILTKIGDEFRVNFAF